MQNEVHQKEVTFRGMDGYAGFRHGRDYELELAQMEPTEEPLAEVVIIHPVSRLYMYFSKQESGSAGRL